MVNSIVVYSEIYEILRQIDKLYVMKIPVDILSKIKEKRDPFYKVDINWNIPLEEQNFHEDTINILGWFNYNYWTEGKEKKEFEKILKVNESKALTKIVRKNFIVRLLDKIKQIIGKH